MQGNTKFAVIALLNAALRPRPLARATSAQSAARSGLAALGKAQAITHATKPFGRDQQTQTPQVKSVAAQVRHVFTAQIATVARHGRSMSLGRRSTLVTEAKARLGKGLMIGEQLMPLTEAIYNLGI